jgi:hypothetical protein
MLEKMGEMIYKDYNKKNPSQRSRTLKTWEEVFQSAEEMKMPVGVEGGNAYVLKYADWLFNIPAGSSGFHIEDESVPFYQMVVHGMVPYSSEPGNLAYDLTKQKLQWIEYGCVPFFELTYESTDKLKYTEYNRLFNSQYESWINAATDIYNEFNLQLKDTWDAKMTGHEKINRDLVKVSYSNGVIVYINYSNNAADYDGYHIKAKDYLVIAGGGTGG